MKRATKKNIISELSAIAFSDMAKYVSIETDPEEGQVLRITDTSVLKSDARKAICSVKTGTKGIEVKLYDKMRALELLGRMLGIFTANGNDEKEALEELKTFFETGL